MANFFNRKDDAQLDEFKIKLEREISKRKEAERLLEEKSLELYYARQALEEKLVLVEKQNSTIEAYTQELLAIQDQLSESLHEITDSIQYARRLQRGLLQSSSILAECLNGFCIYEPKSIVGGDFYWYHIQDEKICFAAGDCTGHGVPGAMMTMFAIQALHNIILQQDFRGDLQEILSRMHEMLVYMLNQNEPNAAKDGMDMAICRFNRSTLMLEYASALLPVWIVRGNELIKLPINRRPVGGSDYYQNAFWANQFQLLPGDICYLFTDGLQDQFNPEYKKIGSRRIGSLLLEIRTLSMPEQKEKILAFLNQWRGNIEQQDDIFMTGIRVDDRLQ